MEEDEEYIPDEDSTGSDEEATSTTSGLSDEEYTPTTNRTVKPARRFSVSRGFWIPLS